jgi:Holliday junction resolvase RusA-like endonuclease
MISVSFTVRGLPVPQGSSRAFAIGGKARIVSTSAPLSAWRNAIAVAASREMGTHPVFDESLEVNATFLLPRPVSVPKGRVYPSVKPDIDKLTRALFDALTGVVWRDDSRVVQMSISKRYSDTPGVQVSVEVMP